MKVILYGTRGSVAVANNESKKYGGNTTCLYVETKTGKPIIIDSGTGIRTLGVDLVKNSKRDLNMIFTHYHWDHIQGFPFFAPMFFKNVNVAIYGSKKETSAKTALTYQMTLPYFPATLNDLLAKVTFKEMKTKLKIGEVMIETIPTNHPNYTIGLKFSEGKNSFAFLTDNELKAENCKTPYEKFVAFLKGVKFFIHDAQYTDEIYPTKLGWGHSTFSQVMQLAKDAGVKRVVFTHHDHSSTDAFIDKQVKEMSTLHPGFNIQAAADGKSFNL